jgi:hypothetical protein
MTERLTTTCIKAGLAAAAMLGATCASAELFKCTNEQGKTVFSDQRCENMPAKVEAAPVAKHKAGDRYQPTAEDQERIRKLEHLSVAKSSTSEQKSGAILEVSTIRSGQDARMSAEDHAKREVITKELGNPDPQKRAQALRDLRTLYGGL